MLLDVSRLLPRCRFRLCDFRLLTLIQYLCPIRSEMVLYVHNARVTCLCVRSCCKSSLGMASAILTSQKKIVLPNRYILKTFNEVWSKFFHNAWEYVDQCLRRPIYRFPEPIADFQTRQWKSCWSLVVDLQARQQQRRARMPNPSDQRPLMSRKAVSRKREMSWVSPTIIVAKN